MLAIIGYILVAVMVLNLCVELLASDHSAPSEPEPFPLPPPAECVRYLIAIVALIWLVWYVQ